MRELHRGWVGRVAGFPMHGSREPCWVHFQQHDLGASTDERVAGRCTWSAVEQWMNPSVAEAVLKAAERTRMSAYVVLSLLTGARTEELRALSWDHVDLDGDVTADPPVPPYVAVWRSVRKGGDTKTRKSRRTLALPARCVDALRRQKMLQAQEREAAGSRWQEHGLVFASKVGTALDPSHVRRDFRAAIKGAAGVNPDEWTPRELRHSFVSLLSDHGLSLEEISRLVGHSSTSVTEAVYRKQIRPVVEVGAVAMDRILAGVSHSLRHSDPAST